MRRPAGRATAAKITAALGAASLIGAFAMASLMEPFQSLGQVVMTLDERFMTAMDRTERTGVSLWIWSHVAIPILSRPAWMLPTMLGVVLIGAAAQLAWGSRR